MTSSRSLFWICISFVLGITLQSIIKIPHIFSWGFLMILVLAIAIPLLVKKYKFALVGLCVLFFIMGIVRLQSSEFSIANDALSKLNDNPEKITLVGQIVGEPDARDTFQKLNLKIENTQSIVLVTIDRYPEYQYLDTIKVIGKLKTPVELEDFDYKNYLAKDGIYSVMDFPKVELISNKHDYNVLTFLYEKILLFKGKLKESINTNFASPHSVILEGVILGSDKNMPKDVRSKLNGTGLSHLTAISGSNVVILSSIMMVFLLALGFWRGQAFYFSVIFIWLYIVIAGFPASGIRAAIMATVFLSAQKFGRQNTSSRTIVLVGSLMLLQNPMLLAYDIGFQLSFLASMGIIYLKPIIDSFLQTISQEKFKNLTDIISITLSAQIFTLPIIAYNFKSISLIAPVTNLLVISTIDWVMILGFLASLLGIFSQALAFIFMIPCWFLLSYFLKVMNIFYQPWATWPIQNLSWIWVALYYFTLIIVTWALHKYQKSKSFL